MMGCVALTSLISTIEFEFLQSTPRVSLQQDDELEINSFLAANLYCLQAILQEESTGTAALKDLEIQIRDFALKAEDDIEIHLSNILLTQDTEYQEKASHELHQSLREAARNATELLKIITREKESCVSAREMASVALTILITKFKYYFVEPFPIVYLGDEAAILIFLGNLSSLQLCFLHPGKSYGAAIKKLETKIRIFSLKAEDDIEMKLRNFLLAKDTDHEEEASLELHQTLQEADKIAAELLETVNKEREVEMERERTCSFLTSLRAAKNAEYQEKAAQLNQTLQEAAKNAEDLLMIINSRSNEVVDEAQPWNVESSGSSQRFLNLEDRMVGRRHDYTVICDQLVPPYEQPSYKIISIVGMVGIGKTILAKNVYEDTSVASHFIVRGWVTMPKDYNKSQMLRDLLQSFMPAEPNVIKKGSTPDELQMQVRKCLLGRRYLIVVDNILSKQAWLDIRQCVPYDINGSCLLLTTSHYDRGYFASHYVHHMTLLDPNESWDLFCNICCIKEHMAPKFEKIRNHVVEKCDGLPELIVEVAKRLSKCNNIQQRWKKIEKELESLGILDRNALTACYNRLPHHLKVCFLYVGVFPKRNKVQVKMLTRLWIAEGFVKPLPPKGLEGEAYGYLEELVDRSLLLIENRSSDGKVKTCRMHSALHSFCVGEAQKEGIFCAVNTLQHSGLSLEAFKNSCRWLSICSHSFDYYVLFRTNIPRSIFIFHENPEMFVRLKLLRVMVFDTCILLQRVPVHLGDLVFLRYLSITQWFEDMGHVVSNNPNLQTLVVSGNGSPTVHLPSSIWKPPHLRHLELGNSYTVDPPSMVKESLQSLSWVVRPIHCRKEVYSKFPNIKKLKIFLRDETDHPSHTPIILDHFDYLKELEKLTISVQIECGVALAERCMFPSRLKKLRLRGTNLSERDLTVIGMLPWLMVLKLENAFHGTTVWKVAKRGFRSLSFLLLEDTKLKQWEWETCDDDVVYGFPMLEHMVLRSVIVWNRSLGYLNIFLPWNQLCWRTVTLPLSLLPNICNVSARHIETQLLRSKSCALNTTNRRV